jgi:hypothetical protein
MQGHFASVLYHSIHQILPAPSPNLLRAMHEPIRKADSFAGTVRKKSPIASVILYESIVAVPSMYSADVTKFQRTMTLTDKSSYARSKLQLKRHANNAVDSKHTIDLKLTGRLRIKLLVKLM